VSEDDGKGPDMKKGSLQDTLYKEIVDDYLKKLEILKGESAANNLKEITTTNISLAETYFSLNDFEKALYHYNQSALCEETLDMWEDRVKIFEKMGEIYTLISKWPEALKCFRTAREIAEQNKDDTEHWTIKMSEIYHGMGRVHWRLGNYDKAEHYIKRGISLSKGMDINTSNNYVELANLMVERGQMEQGANYYNTALDILKDIGDLYYQSRIFNNLSDMYLQNGEYEKCLEYVELCIENSIKTQNRRLLGYGYVNGAEALGRLNRIEEALDHASKGEEIFSELKEPYCLGFLNHVYGIIYRVDSKIPEAKEKMQKAIDYYTEADIPYYIAKAHLDLALLEQMDDNTKNAMEQASKALDIFTNLKAEKMMEEAGEFLKSLQG